MIKIDVARQMADSVSRASRALNSAIRDAEQEGLIVSIIFDERIEVAGAYKAAAVNVCVAVDLLKLEP